MNRATLILASCALITVGWMVAEKSADANSGTKTRYWIEVKDRPSDVWRRFQSFDTRDQAERAHENFQRSRRFGFIRIEFERFAFRFDTNTNHRDNHNGNFFHNDRDHHDRDHDRHNDREVNHSSNHRQHEGSHSPPSSHHSSKSSKK